MFEHVEEEMNKRGFDTIFLSTDHGGFYEKFGRIKLEDGYNFFGKKCRIYHTHKPTINVF